MSTMSSEPELLLSHEVCDRLRISQRQLRYLVQTGRLSPIRFYEHGQMRFRRDEIERVLRGEPRL